MSENNQSEQPQLTKSSRAFVVTSTATVEEAQAAQRGEAVKLDLSPILAMNEQAAVEHMQKIGRVVLSIVSLELLELQVSLIHQLAQNENILLVRDQVFTINKQA